MTDKQIQLVIPMAGLGTRFSNAGYVLTKPLLPIHGMPMFTIVLANLMTERVKSVFVVAQKSFELGQTLELIEIRGGTSMKLIEIDYVTGGPADTVDLTRNLLSPELPVVVANSDQYVHSSINSFYDLVTNPLYAGAVLTMTDSDPKWSYVKTDENGDVLEVKEKEVISSHATVGVYGFCTAETMWQGFDQMRAANESVNGEFYVAPSYNALISNGARVGTFDVGPIASTMFGMGIPDDYEGFKLNPVSHVASKAALQKFGQI